jgi:hypothetical protein
MTGTGTETLRYIGYDGTTYVSLGSSTVTSLPYVTVVYTSPDGMTWDPLTIKTANVLTNYQQLLGTTDTYEEPINIVVGPIIYFKKTFISTAANNDRTYPPSVVELTNSATKESTIVFASYSVDGGTTWDLSVGLSGYVHSIAYSSDIVVVTTWDQKILYSEDGKRWIDSGTICNAAATNICYSTDTNMFMALSSSEMHTSVDGKFWNTVQKRVKSEILICIGSTFHAIGVLQKSTVVVQNTVILSSTSDGGTTWVSKVLKIADHNKVLSGRCSNQQLFITM